METWVIVGVVLLGVLVGVGVPCLVQLFLTLRSARIHIDRLAPKIDATLTEVRQATKRINRAGSGLEISIQRTRAVFDTIGDLVDSMQRLRDSLRTAAALGGALGPALVAALRALSGTDGFAPQPEEAPAPAPAEEATEENETPEVAAAASSPPQKSEGDTT